MKYIILLITIVNCISITSASSVMFRHDSTVKTEKGIFVELTKPARKPINLTRIPQVVITMKDGRATIPSEYTKTDRPCYLKYVTTGSPADQNAVELLIQAEKLDGTTYDLLTQHDALTGKKAIRIYRKISDTTTPEIRWKPILTLPEQAQTMLADIAIYPDGTLQL